MPWSKNKISVFLEIMAYHNFLTSKNTEILQGVELAKLF